MSVSQSAAGHEAEMFSWSLPAEQQRDLAERLTTFLGHYSHLTDSYIIVRTESPLLSLHFDSAIKEWECCVLNHAALATVCMTPRCYYIYCVSNNHAPVKLCVYSLVSLLSQFKLQKSAAAVVFCNKSCMFLSWESWCGGISGFDMNIWAQKRSQSAGCIYQYLSFYLRKLQLSRKKVNIQIQFPHICLEHRFTLISVLKFFLLFHVTL